VDKNNFGVVGLADQIIYQVNERLLRQITVELLVGEALAVFVVDMHALSISAARQVEVQAGQHRFHVLERISLEMRLCWSSGRSSNLSSASNRRE
jgi:hypothetical protein